VTVKIRDLQQAVGPICLHTCAGCLGLVLGSPKWVPERKFTFNTYNMILFNELNISNCWYLATI